MLANTLNTNEVKNAAGVEVEFSRLSQGPGRETVYAQVGEVLSRKHRLTIKHSETGDGMKMKRSSLVRFDKTVISDVDSVTPVNIEGYVVLRVPAGALVSPTEPANVLAEVMSFLATTGAATTVLFDGTGNGAKSLLNGDL